LLVIRLTDNKRGSGFDFCYVYLRNVNGVKWCNKRVCRIYKELALNLPTKSPEPVFLMDQSSLVHRIRAWKVGGRSRVQIAQCHNLLK
jgi:hypothetical protein